MVRSVVLFSMSCISSGLHTHLDSAAGKLESLRKMEKEWRKLADQPDNWHTVSSDTTGAIIDTMNDVLTTDVFGQQQSQNNSVGIAHQAVVTQNDAYYDDLAVVMEYHDGALTNLAVEHYECREEENRDCNEAEDACWEKEKCTSDPIHSSIPDCVCTLSEPTDLEIAENLKSCMEEVGGWTTLVCEDANTLQWHKDNCDTWNSECSGTTADCEVVQEHYENSWCNHYNNLTALCSSHTAAYTAAAEAFDSVVDAQTKLMGDNLDVCKAAKKVICWVGILDESKSKQECLEYDPTPECVELTNWTAPTLPSIHQCDVSTLLDGVPGDDEWPRAHYNQSRKNYLTDALNLYHGDLSIISEGCPHTRDYPVYNASQQPLGVVVDRGSCAIIKQSGDEPCSLCHGDCYSDSECASIFAEDGSTINLVCAREWMYGEEDLFTQKHPIGCDPDSLAALGANYSGYLGVCALPGDYTCHGSEDCTAR